MPVITALLRAAAIVATTLPTLAHAALPPAGSLYKLNVSASFEPSFVDCWTFSTNGRFIHSPMLKNFPYQLSKLNTQAGQFEAIWVGRVSIAFAGATSGTTITGDAVDANTRTYHFTGTQVSSCAGVPTALPGHGGFLTH
jgi:hypothetical protein